jgi:hypothetical protein
MGVMMKEIEKNFGWICPRCKVVKSPSEITCSCPTIVKEDKNTTKQELLLETTPVHYSH